MLYERLHRKRNTSEHYKHYTRPLLHRRKEHYTPSKRRGGQRTRKRTTSTNTTLRARRATVPHNQQPALPNTMHPNKMHPTCATTSHPTNPVQQKE